MPTAALKRSPAGSSATRGDPGGPSGPGIKAAIDAEVEAELEDAIEYGRNGPLPDPSTATDYAYASGLTPRKGA